MHTDPAIRPDIRADRPAAWFGRWCTAVAAGMPFGLKRIVAPSFVGYLIINGFTFGVDLTMLTLMHGLCPLPVAVTLAYLVAFGLGFLLNRRLNFRSQAPIGRQAGRYAVVTAVNYVVFILGAGAGLTAIGVEYHIARVLAGLGEAGYMYSAMRRLVFRRGSAPELGEELPDDTGRVELSDGIS